MENGMINFTKAISITILSFFTCFAMVDSTDYLSGVTALNRGEYRVAKEKLSLAYNKNPNDSKVKLAYALVAPCSTAVVIYKSLTEQSNISDSLKSAAYVKLGQYYYISKNYNQAANCYRNASKYGKNPEYRHYWALAALASGDRETAKSIWHTLTLEYGDTLSEMAQCQLGLLCFEQKKYQDALNYYAKAGAPAVNHPWAVTALAGKLECVKKLGLNEEALQFEAQLQPYRKLLIENLPTSENKQKSEQITADTVLPVEKNQDSNAITVSEMTDTLGFFTLQVGAFSSKDNAQALVNKVKIKHPSVSIVPLSINDKLFYRVWIGAFKSKSEAEHYGLDSLKKTGLSFRIVEKQE